VEDRDRLFRVSLKFPIVHNRSGQPGIRSCGATAANRRPLSVIKIQPLLAVLPHLLSLDHRMEADCLRHTDFPHTSRLFAEYLLILSGFPVFTTTRRGMAGRSARRRTSPFSGREAGGAGAALRKQNAGNRPLDLLARPGTMAVVTGQQVGLFSGPAYTVYKALTAARLARDFTERGIPSVPVFWLATEDHDFAEVRGCWVFDGSHRAVRLEMSGSGRSGVRPDGLRSPTSPVEELRAALGSFAFGKEVVAAVERTFVPGRTLGEAFGTF